MLMPARERCLLGQQSLCKSAVCFGERCLPLAGMHTWPPLGRTSPMCKAGGNPAPHPSCSTGKQRPPPQHTGAAVLCSLVFGKSGGRGG